MVFLLIGIAIGILLFVVLILKAIKTPSREILGADIHCGRCGYKTNGSKCPRCDKPTQFGV